VGVVIGALRLAAGAGLSNVRLACTGRDRRPNQTPAPPLKSALLHRGLSTAAVAECAQNKLAWYQGHLLWYKWERVGDASIKRLPNEVTLPEAKCARLLMGMRP
jgi:hypothetical protein